jgi:hypothetical protein
MIIPFLAPRMEQPYRSLIVEEPSSSLELEPLSKDRVLALQFIQDKCTGIETLEMAFDPAWSSSPLLILMTMIKRMVKVKNNREMMKLRTLNKQGTKDVTLWHRYGTRKKEAMMKRKRVES